MDVEGVGVDAEALTVDGAALSEVEVHHEVALRLAEDPRPNIVVDVLLQSSLAVVVGEAGLLLFRSSLRLVPSPALTLD